ncbi:MAG TPA: RNHCP domain-containing protein [Ktedonobacterales bacterium]
MGSNRRRGRIAKDAKSRRTRMPPEEIPSRHPQRGRGHTPEQSFTCGHCKRFVGLLPSGGHHRNHCPFCLYSRHVDESHSGDRASACKSLMAPIGAFQRPNGEHVIVHRCLGCGFERFNRIAADDDFDLVLELPVLPPRSARPSGDVIE